MRGKLAFVLALGSSLVLVSGAGAWTGHGARGDWFTSVCATTAAAASVPGWADCRALVASDANGTPQASTTPPPAALGPAQFHKAYNLPTTAAGVQTIAIVDAYDDPKAEADLAVYSNQYGLPPCTTANGCFKKVNQTGGTTYPATDAGWALEISLDVQVAHAICQNCKILLVEAKTASIKNLGTAVNEAVKLGANVVSNSYGGSEYSGETRDETSYFKHPGVAITVSSGDSGYGVSFPAASQYVTAVGGTTLNLAADGSYASETAWSGSGSGCSAYVAKPTWQTDTGCARRTVADVSADADPASGAAVYDSVPYQGASGWYKVGGTSLAAPLVGAVYALAGNASATTYGSYPYSHSTFLHDVRSGSNGSCTPAYLCTALTGFDGPTGLGTPNGIGGF
jgi:subtilase family serine protease